MSDQTTQTHFRQLLFWALLAGCGSALLYLGVGLTMQATGTLLSAAVVGAYVVVLQVARQALARGDQGFATWLVSFGLVLVAVVLTLAQPALWVCYAIVPMLAAAVILQYAPRGAIAPALIVCGLATGLIAGVGEALVLAQARPALFVIVLRITSLSTTVAFVLLLLWQFRVRLHATLDTLQHSSEAIAARNTALAETNQQLEQQMRRSAALVDQVLALETPVTTLDTAVLYAPLVGHLTTERAENLRARLLSTVHERRARWVIVDIQGVPEVDTRIAGELHATFQALTLLGCQVCLCGITAPVAVALTQLELGFSGVLTVRSPQEALLRIQREHHTSSAAYTSAERAQGTGVVDSVLTAAARGEAAW